MSEPLPTTTVGRRRSAVSRLLKRFGESPALWRAGGKAAGVYMRLVRWSSPLRFEPGNPFVLYADRKPFILATWHGHQTMAPFLMAPGDRIRALISKSRDGDMSAAFMGTFGVEPIRGSGGRDPKRSVEKGAVRGFLQMKKSLDEGVNIGIVADVAGSPRRAGNGVIALARASGRPIVAVGFATSRWVEMRTWDRSIIHLPFSRAACVAADPIDVPRDADDALLEAKRLEVESALDAATARAYQMVGRPRP
jgi:lysophospholipid acyltransferase (LPLAT)-like uncharacterized protein